MAKPKTREQIEFENRKNIFKLGALVFAVLVIVVRDCRYIEHIVI